MSSVYATEPQTSGRVILETTHGPLEIQLFCRECPATTKLFLQLCQDGYYNGMVFHRIIPKFLIQTGAIRSVHSANQRGARKSGGANGASADGLETANSYNEADIAKYRKHVEAEDAVERRRYELNSRIRFNHRGQVAMALTVSSDDVDEYPVLQPQFFITLEEASNLDGSHVVFGTIQGPTIQQGVLFQVHQTDAVYRNHGANRITKHDVPVYGRETPAPLDARGFPHGRTAHDRG